MQREIKVGRRQSLGNPPRLELATRVSAFCAASSAAPHAAPILAGEDRERAVTDQLEHVAALSWIAEITVSA